MPDVSGSNVQFGGLYESSTKKQTMYRKHNGFSPDSIIQAIKKGQEIRENSLQKKIDAFEKEHAALLEGDQYIGELLQAAKALSNPRMAKFYGEQDVFGARRAQLRSSSPTVSSDQVVKVVPAIGAAEASMSIRVDRIATKDVITSQVALPNKTDNITANETTIYIKDTAVIVPANATLEEIAGAINSKSSELNLNAYARKFSDTDYRLYIGGTSEGEKITLSSILDQLDGNFDSEDTALGLSGTVVVGGEEVVITSDMTLQEVATALSSITDVVATVNGAGPYNLNITQSLNPTTLVAIGTEKLFDQLGLSESASSAVALQASFFVDGNPTEILSPTNHIGGLLHKTTIHLLGPSGGETITADIEKDKIGIEDGVKAFVSSYNALMVFTEEQTAKDPKKNYDPKEGANLAKNRDFKRLIEKIRGVVSRITPGVSGINHISEIGLLKDENNLLRIDEEKFSAALENNLLDIERVFASVVTKVTGGYFHVIRTPEDISATIADNDVSVSVTKNSSGEYSARLFLDDGSSVLEDLSITTGSSDISVSADGHVTLSGPSGSVYEGLTFFYGGPEITTPTDPDLTTETQVFKITQGFSAVLSARLERATYSDIKSTQEADHTNDLDRLTFQAKRKQEMYEKKLKNLQKKHLAQIKREEDKAQKFQLDMEKVSTMGSSLKTVNASLY